MTNTAVDVTHINASPEREPIAPMSPPSLPLQSQFPPQPMQLVNNYDTLPSPDSENNAQNQQPLIQQADIHAQVFEKTNKLKEEDRALIMDFLAGRVGKWMGGWIGPWFFY